MCPSNYYGEAMRRGLGQEVVSFLSLPQAGAAGFGGTRRGGEIEESPQQVALLVSDAFGSSWRAKEVGLGNVRGDGFLGAKVTVGVRDTDVGHRQNHPFRQAGVSASHWRRT